MSKNIKYILVSLTITLLLFSNVKAAKYIIKNEVGPGITTNTKLDDLATEKEVEPIINIASGSNIYLHDGIYYVKGEDKGQFSLTGYCACSKCGTGTGITASGKPVREAHTIAADWKVLPKGTVIILEDAVGKDGQVYDGVYVVEDRGGGVKNNHLDIYRPTHELASLVTYYGRAYGKVYIAEEYKPFVASSSDIIASASNAIISTGSQIS